MRPFVLITDHPPLTAAVAPVIAAVGAELRVVTTWAEGMVIEHQGALVYLTPFPLSEAELAQHPTPLLSFCAGPQSGSALAARSLAQGHCRRAMLSG